MSTRSARHLAARALAILAVGLLVTSCGLPTHSDVHVEGPLLGTGPTDDHEPLVPDGPDDATTPSQLVDSFLLAAAADPDNAVEHLRPFVHPDEAEQWQPDPRVLLVRVIDQFPTPGDRVRVRLDVRIVGTLSNGAVEPRDDTRTFELEVVPAQSGMDGDNFDDQAAEPRYRIVNPPDVIMLSDRALAGVNASYLTPSPIYFWDSDQRVLVPDLRWLPTAFGTTRRAQTKLEWLVQGPAPWLEAVSSLPGDVDLEGNVVAREDRLDVTLTPAAAELNTGRLHAQLWWTLYDEVADGRPVWLTIDGDERAVEPAGYANPLVTEPPASYVLLNGAVVPYESSDGTDLPSAVADFDGDTHAAAVSSDGHAALVHVGPDGLFRLTLATTGGLRDTDQPAQAMSRPVWLRHPGGTGLVAADGALHRFSADDATLVEVPVSGVTEPITSLAVAPDGRRVAFVAGGRLYMASLIRRDETGVGVSSPRRLATAGTDLAGVTFLRDNWLAVIGDQDGQKLLYELTVDGAFERELPNGALGAPEQVTSMVGYPGDPLSPTVTRQRGEVLYEADGTAYRYRYNHEARSITAEDLAFEVPEEDLDAEPRAPFYRE